jgi:carbonic anhydrase
MSDSVRQSVLDDIAELKASPLVRQGLKDGTRGFVFDIKTGLLEEVVA